ncbi:flagellar biosynthesis anti-sigma factor FlgM [Heliorestis acidaminivorans]|uniref:Negative regulator of flagellin synthesis n=1 Tax=Heliorestis acidaminivorans TaxID=553427 RepID=A0A6I0F253_9FIRM|nr:flagellar biosynthesis anti-sigma factor FlgM [Heliorestis acidaminivorans]KAB2953640.1 flagellar biosynthesis anti-sigma factor FlgM [Heliorestis acidaminivorans]
MKISSNQIQNILKMYGVDRVEKKTEARPADKVQKMGKDKVSLSEDARLLQAASKVIQETPEIREEVVEKLRQKIESGTYNVSGEKIAEKMIGRSLIDRLESK